MPSHPLKQSATRLPLAATNALHAATHKDNEKRKKHEETRLQVDMNYVSIILETSGAYLPRTLEEIAALVALRPEYDHPPHALLIHSPR